jgi:hypothetical protein
MQGARLRLTCVQGPLTALKEVRYRNSEDLMICGKFIALFLLILELSGQKKEPLFEISLFGWGKIRKNPRIWYRTFPRAIRGPCVHTLPQTQCKLGSLSLALNNRAYLVPL